MTKNDVLPLALGVAFAIVFIALVTFGVYRHWFLPCDSLLFDFGRVADLPARCLNP